MLYESVQGLIEEATTLEGDSPPGIRVYSGGRTLPAAFGTGGNPRTGDFRLAIFGSDPVFAEAMKARASGEADIYLIDLVTPRVTSAWAKQPHEIIGIGRQIGPVGKGWVGTGGILYRAADDPNVILQDTNEHVTGERAPKGRVMHQGGRSYGVVWKVGGIGYVVSQKWDGGSVVVDRNRNINARYDQGLDDNLAGIRRMGVDDIGRRFTNTGQTRGTMFGSCIAVGIKDLAVGYDGGTARFHDQCAFVGEDGKPFSVGGHSGSTIVCMEDRMACARLFAGGPDAQGRDVTFANADLPGGIAAVGGVPELVS